MLPQRILPCHGTGDAELDQKQEYVEHKDDDNHLQEHRDDVGDLSAHGHI